MHSQIAHFLERKGLFDPARSQLHCSLLSGGNSHLTWHVRVQSVEEGVEEQQFVVKVAQPDGPLAPYDVRHESQMMAFAHESGIPTPEVIGYLSESEGAAASLIAMRFVAGDVPSLAGLQRWLDSQGGEARLQVGRQMIRAIGRLRKVRPAHPEPFRLSAQYTELVTRTEQRLREAAVGVLELPETVAVATRWLIAHFSQLDAARACLVHGDFRIGNAIFRDTQLVAVLDWERAMTGHPMHDVGYLCLPGMRIGERISGLLTQRELGEIWAEEVGEQLNVPECALLRIVSIYIEFCMMLRVMARLAVGVGRLEGLRPLPLIVRLHVDLLAAMRSWDSGQFTL
jgi:aminoglycoside phosphotransferase (APT) family kinase protein